MFDFKKSFKEQYMSKVSPSIIDVPAACFIAVRGSGDPNEVDGEYANALTAIYSVAYTLKMSYKGSRDIEGFYQYVVPPLEGFWWQENVKGVDYAHKEQFQWISLIRLPEFVTREVLEWAKDSVKKKKKIDTDAVMYFEYHEGLSVQSLHVGPYDNEPATVAAMDQYANDQGYIVDINDSRYHHEIYLSDPRKTKPELLKTIVRHPIRKKNQ